MNNPTSATPSAMIPYGRNMPTSLPERFEPKDFVAAILVFLVTLGVYVATLAPNVTMEDSGELITGAVTFGVPHPPGYPLWTLTGFIFSRVIPIFNVAWRVNLVTAFFGASANALVTLLVAHSSRWLLQRWAPIYKQATLRPYSFYAAIIAGFSLGFSDVMWSQSVIAAVHSSLNAFFITSVLFTFYLWILRPDKLDRLLICVFIFGLGLTNHHTLMQIIPAFGFAALLLSVFAFLGYLKLIKTPVYELVKQPVAAFCSFAISVCIFSLSILAFLSWLSHEDVSPDGPGKVPGPTIFPFLSSIFKHAATHNPYIHTGSLHTVCELMAWLILIMTLVVSFLFIRKFSVKRFLTGALIALGFFLYAHYFWDPASPADYIIAGNGHSPRYGFSQIDPFMFGSYVHSGWAQLSWQSFPMLLLAVTAIGCLYTSGLNSRMVQGFFCAGWLGLVPYTYELVASDTNPPMNWGHVSSDWGTGSGGGGFYYSITRGQYSMNLPSLIKTTIAKKLGVTVDRDNSDASIGQPFYWPRLLLTFEYYFEDLMDYFTVPLIFFPLVFLIYVWRADLLQWVWILLLVTAMFTLAFLLHIIEPPPGFDTLSNLSYKVFFLQSHCILMIFLGYGVMAGVVLLHEILDPSLLYTRQPWIGMGLLFLTIMPLWNNFDDCNQAGHWFGWTYGYDMLAKLPKGAVFYGGNDPGRFIPTYMVFCESQQSDIWKRDPHFDRRDIFVITQNALCDKFYLQYILDQYDARDRRKEWTPFEKFLGRDHNYPKDSLKLVSQEELVHMWDNYMKSTTFTSLSLSTDQVFDLNGEVAQSIFEQNKDKHAFYVEQSIPIVWMQPYLVPDGLIFRLNPTPMEKLSDDTWPKDRAFWLDYCGHLLGDPNFLVDKDARHWYATLIYNRGILCHYRQLPVQEEFYYRLAITTCPYDFEPIFALSELLRKQGRYPEVLALMDQSLLADPRNSTFSTDKKNFIEEEKAYDQEKDLRAKLVKTPDDLYLLLKLAETLMALGKQGDLTDVLRRAASAGTNWTPNTEGAIISRYISAPDALIAFLRVRQEKEPTVSQLSYTIAATEAQLGRRQEFLKDLVKSFILGGPEAQLSAQEDNRFANFRNDPDFLSLIHGKIADLQATNKDALPPQPAGTNTTNPTASTNTTTPPLKPTPTPSPSPTRKKRHQE